MSERQREELLEMRRLAEHEMQVGGGSEDGYYKEYLVNIDELLRLSGSTAASTVPTMETEETAR